MASICCTGPGDELLKTVSRLSAEKLAATYPNERWSINGILGHIGGAEWWYLVQSKPGFSRERAVQRTHAHA